MQEKINKLLDILITTIEKGGDFASHQMPEIAQEIITYNLFTYYITIAALSLLLVIPFMLFRRFKIYIKEDPDNRYNDTVFGHAFGAALSLLVILMIMLITVVKIVKIKTAPKLFLIEEVSRVIK